MQQSVDSIKPKTSTYLEAIQGALHTAMERSKLVYVIGEDILDPYGGAFRATKGLSTKYPDRVITTPISEAAIVGIGTGMAIRGMRPIVEIMFGDFLALCMDQLLNSASKFPLMYKGKVTVPLVIRTPMGAGRGYGPTHSQSLEKYFLGMPGLDIVAPSIFHDPGDLLLAAIFESTKPVVFVENKILYSKKLFTEHPNFTITPIGEGNFPTLLVKNHEGSTNDVLLVTYGGTSEVAKDVMQEMIDEEIKIACVCPSLLNDTSFCRSLQRTAHFDKLIILEEGTESFNWGSEIAATLYDSSFSLLKKPILRLAPPGDAIPASKPLENDFLINKTKLTESILNIMR